MSAEAIYYYRGRPLTDMSREELIEAIEHLGISLEAARETAREERDFYRTVLGIREDRRKS